MLAADVGCMVPSEEHLCGRVEGEDTILSFPWPVSLDVCVAPVFHLTEQKWTESFVGLQIERFS